MPAKTPIYLKPTNPKKGKKLRLRDILSGDMISPPLGEVRHSAHVGPEGEGDMFGDVDFLQGKMDMLPSSGQTQNSHSRSHSVVTCQNNEGNPAKQDPHNYSYNGYHYEQPSTGLLKNTISMPVFIAHEQAPPKPPRLHLDDPSAPCLPPQQNHHQQSYGDISISPGLHRLVPSNGSFSEVSSEDSMSETCGPLEVPRGLSLDSDIGLSNEDLRSDRSDSPYATFHSADLTTPSSVSRSESMMGLNLDLGPSILEDVLGIMERYKL
uniref:Zgc:154093 n=1 Tax=Cynoglossus semilaevis TaxID=244447 RepID=A0A3P8VAF5_CYNSE